MRSRRHQYDYLANYSGLPVDPQVHSYLFRLSMMGSMDLAIADPYRPEPRETIFALVFQPWEDFHWI